MALMTGGAVRLSAVCMTYRRPADTAPHARVLGALMWLGEPRSCKYLPTEELSARLSRGWDAARHSAIRAQIFEARRARRARRSALRKLILVGKPTMDGVAAELVLHPWTPRGLLKTEGFVFKDLREVVRLASAPEPLERTDLSVADAAAALSCASSEAFSTAFRRMCGMSPRVCGRRNTRGSAEAGKGPEPDPARQAQAADRGEEPGVDEALAAVSRLRLAGRGGEDGAAAAGAGIAVLGGLDQGSRPAGSSYGTD
jgi:AraC-like DNA-binding protein